MLLMRRDFYVALPRSVVPNQPVRKATNDSIFVSLTANTLMHESLLISGKTEASKRQTPALQTAL
jgi:hypothetical protein